MKRLVSVILFVSTTFYMAFCVSAFEGFVNARLYIETVGGEVFQSDEICINSSNEYTLTLSDICVTPNDIALIYVKDVNLVSNETSNIYSLENTEVIVKSIKVNGVKLELSDSYRTLANAGRFDFCYYNIYGESFIELPAVDTVTEIELVICVNSNDAPDTGLALAIVPMIVAAAAVVASKRR